MLYDFKDEIVVQDVIVEDIEEVIKDFCMESECLHREEFLEIIVPDSMSKQVIEGIIKRQDVIFDEDDCDMPGDGTAKIITLSSDGNLFCEDAYGKDNTLKQSDSVLTYIYDRFTKKETKKIESTGNSVLYFGFKDENKEHIVTEYLKKDNEIYGFVHSRVGGVADGILSFYSNKPLSKKEIDFIFHL